MEREKDPRAVASGRLGALTVHARGRTNMGPATAAWRANLAREFDISDELEPAERERRMRLALRVRMTQVARVRWGKKRPAPDRDSGAGQSMEGSNHARQSTA